MIGYLRHGFPPVSLLLVIAALWVFSGESDCPVDSWDGSPAIARVGDDCLYSLQYETYLRDLSLNVGLSGPAGPDESGLAEFLSGRRNLVSEFGLENAAFATLAKDLALHQEAVKDGHSSLDAEVMAAMGGNRERIRGLRTLLELHELASQSDLEGFRDLLESPSVSQLIPVQGEEHILALFEEAARLDLSSASKGVQVHSGMLESVGEDLYWTEVYFEIASWLLTVESFRLAASEMAYDESAALRWQNFTEKTWGSTVIELTDAAPESVGLAKVRGYMDGLHALERDLLAK